MSSSSKYLRQAAKNAGLGSSAPLSSLWRRQQRSAHILRTGRNTCLGDKSGAARLAPSGDFRAASAIVRASKRAGHKQRRSTSIAFCVRLSTSALSRRAAAASRACPMRSFSCWRRGRQTTAHPPCTLEGRRQEAFSRKDEEAFFLAETHSGGLREVCLPSGQQLARLMGDSSLSLRGR